MTYHPHGTASGQIGHGVNIDLSDTPSSTGGKFIGFGEDGTSAIANRAHWFLSENIDHVYDMIKQEIAVPSAYKRTAVDQGGGGEVSFQFPTGEDVWVGDDSYPGSAGTSDLEGMMMLFSVLDDDFNELTDGSENEIRVKMVRESTGVTDVYQGGSPFLDSFQDQPVIYFIAVDPVTGATVTDPYTIPTGTAYRVACGIQSTLEDLPADALVRYKTQSSTEVQAGVILQDGTRKMTGNLDLDSNNILNPAEIEGAAASDMLLYSKQDLNFRDQNITTPIPFGETGQSALYQPVSSAVHPGVLGAVNSNAEAREILTANRCVDRTGSITTSGADVTYPALKVMLQGQVVDIPGDTISGTTVTGDYRLVVSPAGVVSLIGTPWGDSLSNPPAGSVIIWDGYFTNPATWSATHDLRWPGTRQGDHVSLYVGSGLGADCTSLDEAITWITWTGLGAVKSSISYEIVIVGEVELAATVTIPKGWALRGLSRLGDAVESPSTITAVTAFDEGTDVIILGDNCTVKDLLIVWDADASQSSGYVGLKLDDHCLVEGVRFTSAGSFYFDSNIGAALQNDSNAGPVIRDCFFAGSSVAAGITAVGHGRIHIDNSTFTGTTSAYHIDLVPGATTLDGTGPLHTITNCFFTGKPTEANIRVGGPNVLIDSCYGKLGTGAATSTFVSIVEGVADNTRAGITMRNCLLKGGYRAVTCQFDSAATRVSIQVEDSIFDDFEDDTIYAACEAVAAGSLLTVRGCTIRSAATRGLIIEGPNLYATISDNNIIGDGSSTETAISIGAGKKSISNNHFQDWTYSCITFYHNSQFIEDVCIVNNFFADCCTKEVTVGDETDVQAAAIAMTTGWAAHNVSINGNIFKDLAGSAIRSSVSGNTGITLSDNIFDTVEGRYLHDDGGANMEKQAVIAIEGAGLWNISNNTFQDCGFQNVNEVVSIAGHIIYLDTTGDVNISGNQFGQAIMGSGDATRAVTDSWYDIAVWGNGDIICNNNSFVLDLTDYPYAPTSYHAQLYKRGTGCLILTGCLFSITGDVGSEYGGHAAFVCGPWAVAGATGAVMASSCFTRGGWTAGVVGLMWKLEGPAEGSVVGCTFDGPHDVDLQQNNGYSLGVVHKGALGKALTPGAYPSTGQYAANTSNPRGDFNRQV